MKKYIKTRCDNQSVIFYEIFSINGSGGFLLLLVCIFLLPSCAIIAPPANNSKAWVYQQENGYYRIALAGTVAFNPVGYGVLPPKNQRAFICTRSIEGDVNSNQLRVFIKGGNWEPTETKSLSGKVSFAENIKAMSVDLNYNYKPKDQSAWNFNGKYELTGNAFSSSKHQTANGEAGDADGKISAELEKDSFRC